MKRNIVFSLMLLISATLLISANAFAASHSFKYAETFKDKVVRTYYGYDVLGIGKITINAKILLNSSTISWDSINGDTVIGLYFEDFLFEEQLKNGALNGNGGFFDLKKRKARFVYYDLYYDYFSDVERNVKYQTVDVKWNKKQLTIKVTCLTSPYDIQFPVLAYYYVGDYESRSVANDQELVDAVISIDGFAVGFYDMNLTGKLKYKVAKKKYDLFDTWNISLKASGIGTVVE